MNPKYELLINNTEQYSTVPFGIHDIQIRYEFVKDETPFPYNIDELLQDLNSWKVFSMDDISSSMYTLSAASGVVCALLDGLGFDFENMGNRLDKIRMILTKSVRMTAQSLGFMNPDLEECLRFINKHFDMSQQEAGLRHGAGIIEELEFLIDRPDIIGFCALILSRLMNDDPKRQCKRGTKQVSVEEKLIGAVADWVINMVSAFSVGKRFAGTGIPTGVVQLVEELSKLPIFNSINSDPMKVQEVKQKLVEDLILAYRKNHELHWEPVYLQTSQLFSVLLNEFLVRVLSAFNVLRCQLKKANSKFGGFKLADLDWKQISFYEQTEILLMVSTAAFTTINLATACVEAYMGKKSLWMNVNLPNIGSFLIHTSKSLPILLEGKEFQEIIKALKNETKYFYLTSHKMREPALFQVLGTHDYPLTAEQVEILYNLEYQKTLIDIDRTNNPINAAGEKKLKMEWLNRWRSFIEMGEPYLGLMGSIRWYTQDELIHKIEANSPWDPWFSKVMFKAMQFRPYFPLITDHKENGKIWLHHRYNSLFNMCNVKTLDDSFDRLFANKIYWEKGRAAQMRKEHAELVNKLNGNSNNFLKNIVVVAIPAVALAAVANVFAAPIAVALAGTQFAGLSGAALTSASLAWLGGGSLAAGGFGMVGGAAVITGGGLAVGATAGTAASSLLNSPDTTYEEENEKLAAVFVQIKFGEYLNADQKAKVKEELADILTKMKEGYDSQIKKLNESLSDQKIDKKTVKAQIKNLKANEQLCEKTFKAYQQYCID